MTLMETLEVSLKLALAQKEQLIREALAKEAEADECRTKIRLINDYRRGRI